MVYSGFDYVENILKCAKDGLQKPEDFGYWGSEDMFKTWGFCGVDKNRDSDLLEISNFDFITKDLISKFPNDFKIENYSHWMVGNVDRLVCRILKYELPFIDEVKEEDIEICKQINIEKKKTSLALFPLLAAIGFLIAGYNKFFSLVARKRNADGIVPETPVEKVPLLRSFEPDFVHIASGKKIVGNACVSKSYL